MLDLIPHEKAIKLYKLTVTNEQSSNQMIGKNNPNLNISDLGLPRDEKWLCFVHRHLDLNSIVEMLSAVRSPCRVAASKAAINPRKFATVVESSGLKVAAIDNGQPSASVTLLVKAGSRYESKAGLAHALKNYAFKVGSSRGSSRIRAKPLVLTFLDFLIEHKRSFRVENCERNGIIWRHFIF